MIRTEIIALERGGGSVVSIALDRAPKRNALTPEMLDALCVAFGSVPEGARSVVLSGEGAAFSAGFDLKLCAADPSGATMRSLLTGLSRCVVSMRGLTQPVVLAVHGTAVAGGCALLGGADVVVAERGTKLGYPVVKIGVSPAVSAPFLGASVAPGAMRARLMDPGLIGAERALELGLVHELCDGREATIECGHTIARTLAGKPRTGVAALKGLLNQLGSGMTDRAGEGLDASLSLTGTDEERDRLAELWG